MGEVAVCRVEQDAVRDEADTACIEDLIVPDTCIAGIQPPADAGGAENPVQRGAFLRAQLHQKIPLVGGDRQDGRALRLVGGPDGLLCHRQRDGVRCPILPAGGGVLGRAPASDQQQQAENHQDPSPHRDPSFSQTYHPAGEKSLQDG